MPYGFLIIGPTHLNMGLIAFRRSAMKTRLPNISIEAANSVSEPVLTLHKGSPSLWCSSIQMRRWWY